MVEGHDHEAGIGQRLRRIVVPEGRAPCPCDTTIKGSDLPDTAQFRVPRTT